MCLVVEIIMLLGGLYALITGKIKLTRGADLVGWKARVVGLILISPLPLALVAGLFLGLLIAVDILPASAQSIASIIEGLIVLGSLAGAAIFGLVAGGENN